MADGLPSALADAQTLHDRIGQTLAGSRLVCLVCDAERTITVQEAARFLRSAWPLCCCETMSLHRNEQP